MTHLSSYEQFIEETKSRVEKADTSCFFVMYLDIAGFQLVNDFYGMEEGNRLLMALERHMEELPDVCLCRRVFSDHYLCLFAAEETFDPSAISTALLANLRSFRDTQRCHHKCCNLHLIGGLCQITDGAAGVINAIDNANIARKKFKDIMRTSLTWFDDDMEERIAYVKQLEVDIQNAFDNDGFTFHLQPKVNLTSGKIVGSEALARLVRVDGEEVSPGSFIPVMERNETIFALDYLMYDKVCHFLKNQIDRGENPLPVSVNMSRLHTQDPDTAEKIHKLVGGYGIPPYLLEFELTETVMMRDFSVAKAIMSKLRGYGYKTSIDDYGSGYAGIMTFQELDFDVLKLDRTFLDEENGKSLRNDAIVRRIVMLAVDFQTTVLCEGIETAEQCERMKNLGCQIGQGYYFSRPLTAEKYLQFCAERKGYCVLPWTTKEADAVVSKEEQTTLAPEHRDIIKPGRIAGLLALIIVAVSVVVDIGFIRFRRGLEKEFTEFFSDGLMVKHVDVIMKNTVFISLVLIVFCLVAGILSFYGYLFYKRKLVLENERYAMLSEFSDTVLFQYFYKSDTLVLTPNANERFFVNTLQKKHYLKEDISVLNLYSGDWILVKDALEHPAGANATKTIRIRVKGKNGAFLWCSLQMRFLYDDGKVIAVVGKVTDISSQKAREEKLVQQAEMDGLTHVYNKFSAEHKIAEHIENGMAGTLFMMDMDNFKKINDVYGHTRGDEALIHFGNILKEVFREDDIIGRIGGDEFVAYILEDGKEKSAEEYAKSIFDRLKELTEQIGMEITISIGMASCPDDGNCYQDIYHAADQAMYQAKRLGKNRYYQK